MKKVVWHFKGAIRRLTAYIDKRYYRIHPLVVVSNNCFGGEVYKRFNWVFNTPFIGLFIYGSDYIKLLKNLEHYLELPLHFIKESKYTDNLIHYPVGLLGDVEIHFMHYNSENEAQTKWQRRLARFNDCRKNQMVIFKFCDRDGATKEDFKSFHDLPFANKISFSTRPFNNVNHIHIKEDDEGRVPDGVKLYVVCQTYFDFYYWIKTRRFKRTLYSYLKSKLDVA